MESIEYKTPHRYRLVDGLRYSTEDAKLVSCTVIERYDMRGKCFISIASELSLKDAHRRLGEWISIPVERLEEFRV